MQSPAWRNGRASAAWISRAPRSPLKQWPRFVNSGRIVRFSGSRRLRRNPVEFFRHRRDGTKAEAENIVGERQVELRYRACHAAMKAGFETAGMTRENN